MKYLILGAGGTGGCLGACLAKAGQEVTWIARGAHLEAIRKNGLEVRLAEQGEFRIFPAHACTMEEYQECPDVVFVCVKYYSLEECIPFLQRVCSSRTLIIPLLNVFSTGELLQERLPEQAVLDGCIYIYGKIEKPGVVVQPSPIFRVFFGYRDGQEHREEQKARQVERDLKAAGIEGHLTETIRKDALQKFSYVSPVGAAGLYFHAVAGDFMEAGEKQELLLQLIREIEELGHAMGLQFEEELTEINLKILRGLEKDADTSMQRDVASGKLSEIDGLVHQVVKLGDRYGLAVPGYRKISRWAKEHGIR
jgi:2-dehydropantoate 2-reductase